MIDEKNIYELCDRIVHEFHPERIILFGSYAYGKPSEDSDVDILVILHFAGSGLRKTTEILKRIKPRIPVDLLVKTPEDVHQRIEWNDFFLQEIFRKGKVLYEAANS